MRIIYLHQYFLTPSMSGGTRSYELARRLVKMGHEVSMITSQSFREETEKESWLQTNEDGIEVHWCNVSYSNYMSYRRRMIAFMLYAVKAYFKAVKLGGDVIYATSTPLTVAIPGILAKKKLKIPMIFEVRDLWPEAPIQLGILPRWLIPPARWLEMIAYRNAQQIVACTPGMRDGVLQQGIDPAKVTVVTNGADLKKFSPTVEPYTMPETQSWKDHFVLIQSGSMGPLYGLDYVLDTAKLLNPGTKILFVLIGEGRERSRLQKRVIEEQIAAVQILGPVKKELIPGFIASADVCLNLTNNNPVNAISSPNKMYEAMAAGKPIVTNIGGWIRELLEENGVGFYVDPDKPEELAQKALELFENKHLLAAMGKRARALAEERFDFDKLAEKLSKIFSET